MYFILEVILMVWNSIKIQFKFKWMKTNVEKDIPEIWKFKMKQKSKIQ